MAFERVQATPESIVLLAGVACVLCLIYQVWREERIGTKRQLIIGILGITGIAIAVVIEDIRSIAGGATRWCVVICSVIIQIHDDFG